MAARKHGAKRIVLPEGSASEAAVVDGIEVLAASSLFQVMGWLDGSSDLPRAVPPPLKPLELPIDLSEVRGQRRARRALEIAAAGGHNLLLMGPPGCGKTMLASRLPTILPRVTREEAIQITRIHSVAGLFSGKASHPNAPFAHPTTRSQMQG